MLSIRKAVAEDLGWINEQYRAIDFALSNLDRDIVLICLVDGEKAGLGRLVMLEEGEAELGGIYTQDNYRGAKVASFVVDSLIRQAQELSFGKLYCIPFEKLASFYGSFGFEAVTKMEDVHPSIVDKYRWCKETYAEPTLLMILENKGDGDTNVRGRNF